MQIGHSRLLQTKRTKGREMTERDILRQRAETVVRSMAGPDEHPRQTWAGPAVVPVAAPALLDLLDDLERAEGDADHYRTRLRVAKRLAPFTGRAGHRRAHRIESQYR